MEDKYLVITLGYTRNKPELCCGIDEAFEEIKKLVKEKFVQGLNPSIHFEIDEYESHKNYKEKMLTREELKANIMAENKRLRLENYNLEHRLNIEKSKSKK